MWKRTLAVALACIAVVEAQSSTIGGSSGGRTDIPRWCGKPYQQGYPNLPPGGMLQPPVPSPTPMLYVQLEPRHSIYDSSETIGEFIVDASISRTHGTPYYNTSAIPQTANSVTVERLNYNIRVDETGQSLVSNGISISSGVQVLRFDITVLEPRMSPYKVVFSGQVEHSTTLNYTATAWLYYLPAKNSGSTVKIDNLYGGMLVANNETKYAFEPLLPFGFYASCSGYLNSSFANVSAYKDLGFNAINPVCAFPDGDLEFMFDWMDQLNLWYQYDMRGSYLNLTSVAEQIPLLKDRSAFLSWYTADEPDGWQHALNSTQLVYELLKEQDPYHPVGLVLNCDNYYFKEYSSGADYIMEDAYPISIDPHYSRPWKVPCNQTYGDCGCDNCVGELRDVSDRLDSYSKYHQWLGRWEIPLWSVLQAFHDGGYWIRDPTANETWAMLLLAFNRKAKGIMSWLYPSSNTLNEAHATFAKVATTTQMSTFLLGAGPVSISVEGQSALDVSYWVVQKRIMVGVVNLSYEDNNQTICFEIPMVVSGVESQPWSPIPWTLSCASRQSTLMITHGMEGLATNVIVLEI